MKVNLSFNPLTFQTDKIENSRQQSTFLYNLGSLLSQIINILTGLDISTMTSPPWTAYACVLTPGAGAITAQSTTMTYLQIGKLVFVNGSVQVTNIGTASGSMSFNLPVAAKQFFSIAFRETGVNGNLFGGQCPATINMQVLTSTNTNPTWANNFRVSVAFSYEAA